MNRIGVLLINLGTPDAPTPEAVGPYLREFLMDGFVIDVPKPLRWFLVNVMIVPRRKIQSAKAYQKVQLPGGSPLRVYTRELAEKVAEQLANDEGYVVEYAMRYGNPSIASALSRLYSQGPSRIIVLPLYPQYAESSFETAVVETKRVAQKLGCADLLSFFPPFYDQPGFIAAFARRVAEANSTHPADQIVFSFHSLPERHLKRLDASGQHCLVTPHCCDRISAVNQNCYRAQCFFTARQIAAQLELKDDDYTVSFQSRLGRAKWIGPTTEVVLRELAGSGVKRVAVSCPSFVADCLETLEEMGIRGRQTFIEAGGEELRLIPSLNADPSWVDTVADWIREIEKHEVTR
ncbi:MAG: protoporphyrin/coproporphyrin ferrochelatase [Blastocatellia bacterium]|nr:protoporphyrin/coproporphyrin ferrochelatase [Blastocatellia bacterium]